MVKYNGINHLALATNDMDMTIRFWRDFLGMRLVAGLGRPDYKHYFFEICEHDLIAFFEWPHVQPIPEKDHGVPVKGPVAFDHVSIGVESEEDLWRLKQKFEAADLWVSEVIDHGFIYSIYAFDPNHIPIEFSYCVPQVDIRKQPQMWDSDPSAIAREGSRPQEGHWPETPEIPEDEGKVIYPGEGKLALEK